MSADRSTRRDAPGTARVVFAVTRIVVAVAIVAAIIGQVTNSLVFWRNRGDEDIPGDLVNFFSFFTMQANSAAAVTLAVGSVILVRRSGSNPRWFAILHLCIASYMITTGIVYNLILRSMPLEAGLSQPWSNEILHLIVPIYLLVDRLFAPGGRRLSFATLGIVAVYPIVWAVYTLGRAPGTLDQAVGTLGWYPYPFLDPRLADAGYQSVASWVGVLLSLIVILAAVLLVVERVRARIRARAAA